MWVKRASVKVPHMGRALRLPVRRAIVRLGFQWIEWQPIFEDEWE